MRAKKAGSAAESTASTGGRITDDSYQFPNLPREFNAATYFVDRHLAEARADKVAYIDDRSTYTYGDLASRTNRAGNMLKKLGVGQEQRVLICLQDGIDFPSTFLGALKIGAIPVPVNTLLTSADYAHVLRDSRAGVAVVSAAVADRFAGLQGQAPHLKATVVSGDRVGELPATWASFAALSAEASPKLAPADTLADEFGVLLYTTGSTGRPKGVIHRHADLYYAGALYGEYGLGIRESDVTFAIIKTWSAYGLNCSIIWPLHAGATAVLMADRPSPENVMELMRRHRPTVFYGAPTFYRRILADSDLDRCKSSDRLRLCVVGGELLPEKIYSEWERRFGLKLLNHLGTTEALSIIVSNRPDDLAYRDGTIGKAAPGHEIRVLNQDGAEVAPGEEGDMWVRGPCVSPGYWNDRAASIKSFHGEWFRTADRVVRDADGYLHFRGRSDDMLRVGANWVSPTEVEACLITHPDVAEAAVIGKADADGLIKPKAFVVLREPVKGTAEIAEQIKQFVKGRLALFKYPRWIEFREELPKTPTGKIQRFRLREEERAASS